MLCTLLCVPGVIDNGMSGDGSNGQGPDHVIVTFRARDRSAQDDFKPRRKFYGGDPSRVQRVGVLTRILRDSVPAFPFISRSVENIAAGDI